MLVRRHLPGFLARLEEGGHGLPEFVKDELAGFGVCGDYAEPGIIMVVQRFRGDLGPFVHLHALATDGAFEEDGAAVRFLPASPPTAERMTAMLAHVHKVLAAFDEGDDLDMDPALRVCVQLALAGPHLVPPAASAAPPPLTVSALGMHLHAATT